MAEAAEAEPHGDLAGQRADGAGGNGVDAALLQEPSIVKAVLFFGEVLAAAAGADDDTDAAELVARHAADIQPGVAHGFGHRRGSERYGAGNMRAILDFDVLLLVELVGNLSRYLHLITRRVKTGNAANPAHPIPGRLPKLLTADSIRADGAYSCDYHTTHRFILPLVFPPV